MRIINIKNIVKHQLAKIKVLSNINYFVRLARCPPFQMAQHPNGGVTPRVEDLQHGDLRDLGCHDVPYLASILELVAVSSFSSSSIFARYFLAQISGMVSSTARMDSQRI